MTIALGGVLAPMTTPFLENGDLDRAGFERNIRAHIGHGLQGVVVTGSTGEAPLLSEREREQLMEWARPHVPGDRLLVAGVGAESTRMTLHYAERAAERGADAVLVVAPHYFASSMSNDAVRAHYLRVADESSAPVVVYNIPKYMHYKIAPSIVQELARHENVIGIKDSTGERESFRAFLAAQSESFSVLTGNGTFLKTALEMGGRGGIVAVSVFAPETTLGVADAMGRRDSAAAEALQDRLTPLARVIVGDLGPAGIKAALDIIGLRGGAPRSPLLPLSGADLDRVRQLLSEAELLVAA